MLEHFRFIAKVHANMYNSIVEIGYPYIKHTNVDGVMIISASARGFLDALQFVEYDMSTNKYTHFNHSHVVALMAIMKHIVWYYNCNELFGQTPCQQYNIKIIDVNDMCKYTEYERMTHEWHSVRFICDRGVSHEMVRHRPASFAQESTRYCNYAKGKFGNELTVIKPFFFDENTEQYVLWLKSIAYIEEMYMQLIHCGATAQEARTILPNSLKTDLVVTATLEEWEHIIELRFIGVTGRPHPQMFEVMDEMIAHNKWAYELCQ